MVKVFVVYDTKHGNTKRVAEKIVEGLREIEGLDTAIGDVENVDPNRVAGYDALVIGGPAHFGGPTRTINRFIDKLGNLKLQAKWVAVFDTYMKDDFEKAVKKMETRIMEKIPGLQRIRPGLSIQVTGMKGPIVEGELPQCVEFGKNIATQLAS
jgi:menaquinone-dependent protoporphyrinogen IX oxidase